MLGVPEPSRSWGSFTEEGRRGGCWENPRSLRAPHGPLPSLSPSDIIHKFIRDKYSKRFPELESLVPNALDYIRTVKVRGRGLEATSVKGRQDPALGPPGLGERLPSLSFQLEAGWEWGTETPRCQWPLSVRRTSGSEGVRLKGSGPLWPLRPWS